MVLVIYVDSDIFMFVNIHEKKLWSKDYVEQGKNISPDTYISSSIEKMTSIEGKIIQLNYFCNMSWLTWLMKHCCKFLQS